MKGAHSPEYQVYEALADAGGYLEERALIRRVKPQVQIGYLRFFQTRRDRVEKAIQELIGLGCIAGQPNGRLKIVGPLKLFDSHGRLFGELSLHPGGRGLSLALNRR